MPRRGTFHNRRLSSRFPARMRVVRVVVPSKRNAAANPTTASGTSPKMAVTTLSTRSRVVESVTMSNQASTISMVPVTSAPTMTIWRRRHAAQAVTARATRSAASKPTQAVAQWAATYRCGSVIPRRTIHGIRPMHTNKSKRTILRRRRMTASLSRSRSTLKRAKRSARSARSPSVKATISSSLSTNASFKTKNPTQIGRLLKRTRIGTSHRHQAWLLRSVAEPRHRQATRTRHVLRNPESTGSDSARGLEDARVANVPLFRTTVVTTAPKMKTTADHRKATE